MKNNSLRLTWLEIDTKALQNNIKAVKNKLSEDTQIMAIVKANAYGHGMKRVAKEVLAAGINHLAVATVSEGVKLRKAGIKSPILILGTVFKKQLATIIEYKLIPNLYNYQIAQELNSYGKEIEVHVKVDTGMGRIGILAEQAVAEIKKIAALENINITGLFSHFAAADENHEYTIQQLEKFKAIINQLKAENIEIKNYHIANSAAIINYPASYFDLVRMGIILYGLYPNSELRNKLALEPVLSWKARIVNLKEVPAGTSISYGCTYTTDKATKIATLPVGYHDGYFRALSNQAKVICHGNKVPIVGRVCMDQFMIDVTGVKAQKGDIVTLLGQEGETIITASDLAEKVDTINYEIVSRIGRRVPRIYL